MPNIIDKQQLQATAQVAKSFILEQDTANVTTIINALQQGGGSATAGKQEGIITLSDNNFYGPKSITYSYNGDATVQMVKTTGYGSATLEGDTITVNESYGFYLLYADATDNFTAAVTLLRVYERDD